MNTIKKMEWVDDKNILHVRYFYDGNLLFEDTFNILTMLKNKVNVSVIEHPEDEFIKIFGVASGGDYFGLLFSAIKNFDFQIWDSLPDYNISFDELYNLCRTLGLNYLTKVRIEGDKIEVVF